MRDEPKRESGSTRRSRIGALCLLALLLASPAPAQERQEPTPSGLVTLDFADAELSAVIEMIAKMTGRNFIYDDRVRGRVTIVSPSPMSVDQAYAVFESVLQVKGFTTVTTPGGAIKVVPIREAKESSVETVRSSARPPNRDRFVTRLIPLNYIDADSIVETLKPLVSKDAAMAAYGPTNTVILTESASNIRRLIEILESIDVETYKEELAVIPVEYADANTLAEQISEIYGAEVSQTTQPASRRRASRRRGAQTEAPASAARAPVRILTDERTNSLLVLAARAELEEVRRLVAKLDVPVRGGGRIHVYRLKNADAEELAQTLSGLIGGSSGVSAPPPGGAGGAGAAAVPAIRAAVTGLAGGISVTADPATNALIIQASLEGYQTIESVIEKLDVERPQVLVEALIMEVDVSDGKDLGFSGLLRTINGDTDLVVGTATDPGSAAVLGNVIAPGLGSLAAPFVGRVLRDNLKLGPDGETPVGGSLIDGIIRASATNGDINIISAPHILTSDNEQAEIRVGDNIPIISSRVEQPTGAAQLSSSVNVERQDIGVTLRVTPQITEGDSLRLEIFQEISAVNDALAVGDVEDVGVALSNRRIENTVIVKDQETVVIGGLIGDQYQDNVAKVPWLGDIPVLGWAFKTQSKQLIKTNLLVFLTPRIVRGPLDLESETIRKREEFEAKVGKVVEIDDADLARERERFAEAASAGVPYRPEETGHPARTVLAGHAARYPLERMREIEQTQAEELAREQAERAAAEQEPAYYLEAAIFGDADAAKALLTDLIDSGHDGRLVSQESGETVLYELQLGPYSTLTEAQSMAAVVRRSHGLSPTVFLAQPAPVQESGEDEAPRGAEQP